FDFDFRRRVRHHDQTGLAKHLTGTGQGLAEISRRSCNNRRVRHLAGKLVSRAKFEAASALESLTDDRELNAESTRESVRRYHRRGPDYLTQLLCGIWNRVH